MAARKHVLPDLNDPDVSTGDIKTVANMLGVTHRMVSNYLKERNNKLPIYIKAGGFHKAHVFNLHDVFQWALKRQMKDVYAGDEEDEAVQYNPKQEQARLHKEKADSEAIKNYILRKEYAPIALLEDSLANISGQITSMLDALPMTLKRRYAWLTGHQVKLLQKEIARMQNAVAKVKVKVKSCDIFN